MHPRHQCTLPFSTLPTQPPGHPHPPSSSSPPLAFEAVLSSDMAAPPASAVAAQIAARAEEMRKDGTYLGLLEWVAFAALEGMKVEMLFGDYVLDVREIFAPALRQRNDSGRVCRTAAVRVGPQGSLLSAVKANGACYPDINHYVIGLAASEPVSSVPAVRAFSSCAHKCALRVNWVLRPTVTDGDCALDAMVASLGVERTMASRQCLRQRIADFLKDVRADAVWQEILVVCEGKDEEVKEAAASSQGGLGPVVGAPGGVKPLQSSAGATSSQSGPPLPPPLHPPPANPPLDLPRIPHPIQPHPQPNSRHRQRICHLMSLVNLRTVALGAGGPQGRWLEGSAPTQRRVLRSPPRKRRLGRLPEHWDPP